MNIRNATIATLAIAAVAAFAFTTSDVFARGNGNYHGEGNMMRGGYESCNTSGSMRDGNRMMRDGERMHQQGTHGMRDGFHRMNDGYRMGGGKTTDAQGADQNL